MRPRAPAASTGCAALSVTATCRKTAANVTAIDQVAGKWREGAPK